jgi:hypothetical protein
MIGIVELLYFGFFCFEPKIWPQNQPPSTCEIPFTAITAAYVAMIAIVMLPLRILLNRNKCSDPDRVSWQYASLTVLHMLLCLGWLIFALIELKYSSKDCWDPFTWQYLNYYVILLLTLGPAMTLGLGALLLICCLPCILQQVIAIFRDERSRREMGERVVNGLAKRTFNPEQFKS